MSTSDEIDLSCIENDHQRLRSVIVASHEDEDSDFETLSYYSSSASNGPVNVLHKLLDDEKVWKNNMDLTVNTLQKLLLISSSKVVDELDSGGSCILHKILSLFIEMHYKDECGVDVIELSLNKSNLDYRTYQKGIVLDLLQQYDKSILPRTIKFLQWQILSREGEKLMIRWHMIQQDTDDNTKDVKKVKKFVGHVYKAMQNEDQLDDMIESIFSSGSLELLKYVKRYIDENNISLLTPLLINAVNWGLFAKNENIKYFQECFEYLLETSDKKILSNVSEESFLTALHTADQFNDEFMIKTLLEKGAPISQYDGDIRFPIQNVSYKILNDFFDSLVTVTPTRFLDDERVWKMISSVYDHEFKLKGFIFMNFNTFESLSEPDEPTFNDFEFIDQLSESSRLCRLIDHPILATLLELHWYRFKKWILLDQISVLYMILMIIVFFGKYAMQLPEATCEILDYLIACCTVGVIFGELIKNYKIFQLFGLKCINAFNRLLRRDKNHRKIHHFTKYQTVTSVFIKMPLLCLMIYYAILHCDHQIEKCHQTIGISLILFSINFTLLIAYFSQTVAHYTIMFVYVAYTGFRFIVSMFSLLFGFGLGLYMLINNFKYNVVIGQYNTETPKETSTDNSDIDSSTITNTEKIEKQPMDWGIAGLSFFRTFVMSTGELEVSSFEFHSILSYFAFIFFIFVIPIVFFNLLNGLAIEDISVIKREAMFWYRKTQLMVLREFNYLYWKIDDHVHIHKIPCIPKIDISLYPDMIGEHTFIGIDTNTRDIYSMSGMTSTERKCIGRLSRSVLANAKEILGERN